jgi:protoporphyrin/coproporphyrin ferrochelatase
MTTILVLNLGSPKDLNKNNVKEYLREFLSDDLVVDLPKPIQQFILRCFILPFRPKVTKEAYEKIWTEQGSPLLIYTESIAKKLSKSMNMPTIVAMRYQQPSIEKAIKKLKENREEEVIVLPLYPHHAQATTTTTILEVKKQIAKHYPSLSAIYVEPFSNEESYIDALAKNIQSQIKEDFDMLLFSYHGIPERQLKKTEINKKHCMVVDDCCHQPCEASYQCYKSNLTIATEKVVEKLQLPEDKWEITFQSRIGPGWLKPFTDKTLVKLGKSNKKRILVASPAFIADCLETLEEINIRGRESFISAGGREFTQLNCLNDSKESINCLSEVITKAITGNS